MDVEQLRANYTAPGMGKQINDISQDHRANRAHNTNIVQKTLNVIHSCKTQDQLLCAVRYANLAQKATPYIDCTWNYGIEIYRRRNRIPDNGISM